MDFDNSSRTWLCLILWISGFLAGIGNSLADVGKPPPGQWPEADFSWSYNPQHAPSWLPPETARSMLIEAATQWEACGVRMKYLGETELKPGRMDGRNVVGWVSELPGNLRGITQGQARAGRLLERDITFAADRREFRRSSHLLRKVMTHEFGHAIGLTHSARCDDVMTLAADCPSADPETLPIVPTESDLARCRALYVKQ